jgi:hypothetical protein
MKGLGLETLRTHFGWNWLRNIAVAAIAIIVFNLQEFHYHKVSYFIVS